ncbi:helix-turn-helix transcriptional regulator [Flagellimonas hymeniacidonis]|uniref:Helix-turn-helix transcriptional regulator n=1 Tax=Flagellimonas hymeniacidonis TaxID=2603628 RepID=A0A5C8V7R5_9FLAO|nr:helix-turn-helix transcriptional regulator [Flagellimonas hymeniacidonis]TXN37717.1 helix-turn-helix transcriptional regulator [Flagellimonas hymeniacidonis]
MLPTADTEKLFANGMGLHMVHVVGPFLKQKRKNVFVTQKAIYSQGYAQSFISDFENGKRKADLKLIGVYAKALHMEFYDLLIEVIEVQKSLLDEEIQKLKDLRN